MSEGTKILKRLRRQLVTRINRLDLRITQAADDRSFAKAAELEFERHGVAWSIHDLDCLVCDLRAKP